MTVQGLGLGIGGRRPGPAGAYSRRRRFASLRGGRLYWLRGAAAGTPPPAGRRRRGERLIAIGRLALTGFCLLALHLEPGSEPLSGAAQTLIEVYFALAWVQALAVWWLWVVPSWLGVLSHALDLVCFSLLSSLTLGPASPFFVFFVFAMVSATIRWRWRGTAWTAAVAIAVYAAQVWAWSGWLDSGPLGQSLFGVRLTHLLVLALLLGYLGRHQDELMEELRHLSEWPREVVGDRRSLLAALLPRAAAALGASRLALAWEESEEPRCRVARWDRGSFEVEEVPPRASASWREGFAAQPRDLLLLARGSRIVTVDGGGRAGGGWGAESVGELAAGWRWKSALCVQVRGESGRGLLVAFDRPGASPDDLAAGRLVARVVAAQLDQLALLASLRQIAADQERMRLARDLHDGVSQSLAGAALQLEAALASLASSPAEARRRLERVQGLLAGEQRELRRFLHLSRAARPAELGAECLEATVESARELWGLEVEYRGDPTFAGLPEGLRRQVCCLAREALANAARHSGSHRAELSAAVDGRRVRLRIADHGSGFDFVGVRDLDRLAATATGPRVLCERVRALGGSLVVTSGHAGAALEMSVPIAAGES